MKNLINHYLSIHGQHLSAEVQRAHWLVRLRWLAIAIQFAFVLLAHNLRIINSSIFSLSCLIILFMFLFNALLSYALVKFPKALAHTQTLQLSVDLIETTILIFLGGGFSNPFYVVLIINVMMAPLLVSKFQSFIVLLCLIMGIITLYFSPFAFSLQELGVDRKDIDILAISITAFTSWQVTNWLNNKEKKLNSNIEQLQKKSYRHDRLKAVGALTAGLCHELATPLNTVKMRADRILRKDEHNKDAQTIKLAIDQCEKSISSINARNYKLDESTLSIVSINDLISEIVNEISKEVEGIEIVITNESQLRVEMPKHAFTKSIIDLLENSIEANSTKINIHITQSSLNISDNGPGFPNSVIENLGEPFLTTKKRGSGQGLYNSLTLAEYIGASFKIKNIETGALTSFIFTIKAQA